MPQSRDCVDPGLRVDLQHPLFSTFGEVRFRRASTDGAPVLAMRLGQREAQLPLSALQREFAIAGESDDGRMLALIGAALDYVPSLQPGDRLPSEVLTGEASWKPSPEHLRLAATRLRLNLVAWLSPGSRWAAAERDDATLLRLSQDPALAREVQAAAVAASRVLGLRHASQVVQALDGLSDELSYIEALRQRLLSRLEAVCRRIAALRGCARAGASADTVSQVHRLSALAFQQVRTRFDDLEAVTSVFDTLGRDMDSLRHFIRTIRDWLYRSQRAWEPVLARWERTDRPEAGLLAATYRFLAPRFMPTTEWAGARRAASERPRQATAATATMAW